MYEKRKTYRENCSSVYTLNTWTDKKKSEVKALLDAGYYVYLGCEAIGHSLSAMVKYQGIEWVKEEYGDQVEVVEVENEISCFNPKVHLKGVNVNYGTTEFEEYL